MDTKFKIPKICTTILEKMFILYADSDQAPSTTAVRIAGSSRANPYATIGAGIASLWGPQHGGAAEDCLKMLKKIEKVENVKDYIEKCKAKKERIWGFGHRVLKGYDERA